MKKIQLYNTRQKQLETIETEAQTWGELKPQIAKLGFDTKSLLATESIFRNDLVLDEAILPDKDFTIFFRQKDTKAGGTDYSNMSYKECRLTIADILKKDESSSAHFNEGKNYTNKGTAELQALLASYTPPASESKDSAIPELVEAVAKAKEEVVEEPISNLSLVSVALRALGAIDTSSDEELEGRLEFAIEEITSISDYLKEKGEKDAELSFGKGSGSEENSADLKNWEDDLNEREQDLNKREQTLLPKEEAFVKKEDAIKQLDQEAKQIGVVK